MMTSFDQIRKEAKAKGKKRIVVAPVPAAMDFSALSAALAEGLVSPIVIGSSDAIASVGERAREEGLRKSKSSRSPTPRGPSPLRSAC